MFYLTPLHRVLTYRRFICNRLWAAIKRETMMILAEGVSDAQEIDQIYVCVVFSKLRN